MKEYFKKLKQANIQNIDKKKESKGHDTSDCHTHS